MNGNDAIHFIWLIAALAIAISALSVRGLSLGLVARAVLGWGAIAIVVILLVGYRAELGAVIADLSERLGIASQKVTGDTVRIRMSPDGHFWAQVRINGVERRMLVDSGATITAISQRTADAAGIAPGNAGFPVVIETANGPVRASRGNAARVALGPLETSDLGVVIAPNFGDLDVLGMNFLSRLGSWRVEGQVLVLEPKRQGAGAQ